VPVADIGGLSLAYESWGRPADPTVLLVMGLGGSLVLWPPPLVEGLMRRGYRVIAYDHRDAGRSTVLHDAPGDPDLVRALLAGEPIEPPYRLRDLAVDANALLERLEVQRAHVIGTSMGGMVAQHLAMDFPARVASLTLVNSAAGPWNVRDPAPPPPERVAVPPADRAAYVEWFVNGVRDLSMPQWFDDDRVRELAGRTFDHGVHPHGTVRHLLAILADGERTPRLHEVAAPTLVVHGALDPLIDVEAGQALAEAIPGARLLVVDDMAHDLPIPLLPQLVEAIAEHIDAAHG
jgi:pimeloyl-ACP methyl ester carboxylesterase